MSKAKVNTVMGPISPEDMGVTLPHEHIMFGYPGWEVDQSVFPFDRAAVVNTMVGHLEELKPYGLKTLVDATPGDQGRNPEVYKEISEKTGINIICSTGLYHEGQGGAAYWKFRGMLSDIGQELYELFMKEITEGIRGTGIKAGVIKVASSHGCITDFEHKVFQAAAKAHKDTGVPVITHTEEGTMGPEQADLLIAEGVPANRIQIGHMSNCTDTKYHMAVMDKGVFGAFDRLGIEVIAGCPLEKESLPILMGLVGMGYANQLMLSHDFIATWLGRPLPVTLDDLPFLAKWHPTHVFKDIVPALKNSGATDEQIKTIIEDNPRRLYGGE